MRFGSFFGILALAGLLTSCATESVYKISDVTEARALSDYGLELYTSGDVNGALKALDAVIAYGSIEADDYARRAAVYGTQKNYDKALADADRAIALSPKAWRRYLERAVLYQRTGQYAEAIGDLDSAVALQPNEIELLRRRAYLKVVASRFDDAVADYENLSLILPRSDTGTLGRGAALYLAGRWIDAAAQFSVMLEKRPDDGLAALWLAKARFRSGRFLGWDELEAHAGSEPEWLMTRALLTMENDAEVVALLKDVDGCERSLFLGFWRTVHQKGKGALEDFSAAAKVCPVDSIERSEVRVEMVRLQDTAAQ